MVAIDVKYNFGFEVTMNLQKQNYFFLKIKWIQSKSTLLEEMLQEIIEN